MIVAMIILGIETSCDETSAAVVQNGTNVLSNVIATSAHTFKDLGGVIPEKAARRQVECILPVIQKALMDANVNKVDINAIAVTKEPGLIGSLLVGTTTARVLALVWEKPLIEVHHTMGHLSSTWLKGAMGYKRWAMSHAQSSKLKAQSCPPRFPILALSVSGGHSELWYRKSHTKGILLGATRDDAAGEAFDKGASLLGLPYPGGPSISNAAQNGNPSAYVFPLPLKDEPTLDFSFSGLKTALKYLLKNETSPVIRDIAASYQHAICRHLTDRIEKAIKQYPDIKEIHIVGGVSANTHLRDLLSKTIPNIPLRFPLSLAYCTDNAAMIAAAGFFMNHEMA